MPLSGVSAAGRCRLATDAVLALAAWLGAGLGAAQAGEAQGARRAALLGDGEKVLFVPRHLN
ncbi:hypothetical protein D3C76_1811310 [compost metagenome]